MPEIYVKYEEALDVNDISELLVSDDGEEYDVTLIQDNISQGETHLTYQVDNDLAIGKYVFSIKACDLLDNCGEFWKVDFEVELPDLAITWIKPRFGIFNDISLSIEIETNREAVCKHSIGDKSFEDMEGISTTGTDIVSKHIFRGLGYNDINGVNAYIKCRDKFGDEASFVQFLEYDNQAPQIEVSAEDAFGDPLTTTLNVEIINKKKSICKYSSTIPDDFESMRQIVHSGIYDIEEENSYKLKLHQNLDERDLDDNERNTFYVMCMGMNGLKSDRESVSFDVDKDMTIDIKFKEPTKYMNTSNFKINVSTSVLTKCNYRTNEDDDYKGQFLSSTTSKKSHISSGSLKLDEGNNYLDVKCSNDDQTVSEDMNYKIDLTDPEMKSLNVITNGNGNVISEKDKISFNFSGNDNISGIRYYEYIIYEQTSYAANNITNWETIQTMEQSQFQFC